MSSPLLSVIIPTWRRPRQLDACLHSLSLQIPPGVPYEILVAVDGQLPGDAGNAASWLHRLPLRILSHPHAGPAATRNLAARAALGRFLLFTDDDCLLPPDWLLSWARHLASHPAALTAGRTLVAPHESAFSSATQALIDFLHSRWNSDPARATFAVGNHLALPTHDFLALGGFDPRYPSAAAEDRDLSLRWCASGRTLLFEHSLVLLHAHHMNLAGFLRQHLHYGRGARLFHYTSSSLSTPDARLQQGSFYFSLLAWPFRVSSGWPALRLAALFLLAQFAHALGYLQQLLTISPAAERTS